MEFNNDWLNRTPNKWPRSNAARYTHVLWHETASPNPSNPAGTLNYNLSASVESSYHFLIARDGTVYHYVDEKEFTAYHAGKSRLGNLRDFQVSLTSIGIELDGRNDGTPITKIQLRRAAELAIWIRDTQGIPITIERHVTHAQVAYPPGRKSDPRGVTVLEILRKASELDEPTPSPLEPHPLLRASWERSGGVWKPEQLTPGYPLGPAFSQHGELYQRFERGVVRRKADGVIEWLLLAELPAT